MRKLLALGLGAAVLAFSAQAFSAQAARADQPPPPSISVSGAGSVKYAPDIAHVSLGVRAESASAATAAKSVNTRAQAVINALRGLGVADSDIATSNYSIEYQPPSSDDGAQPAPAGGGVQTQSVARKPLPPQGKYVANETLDVKTSIAKAGAVLDAALTAGADETYGVSFDTSQRTALTREALARAVADARSQAEILAKAAGVNIAGVQSISTAGLAPMPMMRMMATANGPAPPVMGGTGSIDVSVQVVYRIK